MSLLSPAIVALASLSLLAAGRTDVSLVTPSVERLRVGKVQPIAPSTQLLVAGKWKDAQESTAIRTGDGVRTGATGAAEIDLAWAKLVLGPSSSFRVAPSRALTGLLEQGRLEQRATLHDIVRLKTPEASIRGHGDVVVRRQAARTAVSALSGAFVIKTPQGEVHLPGGQGLVIEAGQTPAPAAALPVPATGLSPASDPTYVMRGSPARMSWKTSAPRSHVQLVAVGTGEVVHDGDVDGSSYSSSAELDLGLYRWRVFPVSEAGLEGIPSSEGLICVVEK
jgi:hypothetical protein